jgi:iron complex outermembrane recepter protein
MKKILSGFVMLIFSGSALLAQQVTGSVKNDEGKSLEKVSVSLLNAKDSSIAKLGVTGKDGKFSISTSKSGQYLVSTTSVGYSPAYSGRFYVSGSGDVNVSEIVMIKSSGNLQNVSVIAKKPLIEVRADKTILNVENTINATGNDALELLRKSPGVTLDKDDNISMSGKNGVSIYIDGKPSPLSGADLAAYLKSLQSSQIESIELITNPSAKYDAAGNAGIINIKLKKNKAFGINGSVNAGYNIGIFAKYNSGISFNSRNKNVNIFGNYNYNRGTNRMVFNLYRSLLDTVFDGKNIMTNKNNSHGFKTGLDYTLNKKSTLGFLINGNINDTKMKMDGTTDIIYQPTGVTDRILKGDNSSVADRDNVNFNINYRYADTSGREWSVDADYGFFKINTDQYQPNIYYDPTYTNELGRTIYNFISPTDIDIYTLKTDYEQNFKGGKLGFGLKTSIVSTENNFGRYNVNGNSKVLDLTRSNQFDYSENINAAYVNYNKAYKGGVMIQAGVRVENTNRTGDSYALNNDGSVNTATKVTDKRHYTDLFPSAAVTFNKNPMKQWSLSYSRRIDRPAYQNLNPFEFKLNDYSYMKGNIDLRPQYTNSFGLTHIYKYKLSFRLNYSHVKDIFTQLVDTTEGTKSFMTQKNLATQDIASLNISYPFMYKNYMWITNLNTSYSKYEADFGGGNRMVNLDVFAYSLFMQHSLKFGKTKVWTAEVSGVYNSPTIWQGTFESKSIYFVDAGLQKTIFKGKGTVKAAVSDIFKTLKWKGESNFAGQRTIASGVFESRQFKINLTYRFGSNSVKAAKQRKDAAEEEKKRTEGGGGIGIGGNNR